MHNVHYFNYFDIGRFTLVDKFFRQEQSYEISRYLFLVLTTDCKYVHHAQLDDQLSVETIFEYPWEHNNARLRLSHEIFKKKHNVKVALGSTVLGICDREYRLQYRLSEQVKTYLHDQIAFFMNNPDPNVHIKEAKI